LFVIRQSFSLGSCDIEPSIVAVMEVNSPVNFIVFQNRPSLSRRRTPAQPGRQRHSVPPAIRRTDPSIFHTVNPHHDFCVAAISASGLNHFLPFGWTPMLILVE
jgi:hypothetical protein